MSGRFTRHSGPAFDEGGSPRVREQSLSPLLKLGTDSRRLHQFLREFGYFDDFRVFVRSACQ